MENQEDVLLKKRFIDLSRMANRRDIVTFSNFLNLNELNLFYQTAANMETVYQLSGGYEFAERQMIAFIPDALYYEWEFPISCLLFRPSYPKFAEELTHRDVLGALMNLGIERSRIGDIKLDGQNYYIFCEDGIADYLLDSLTQVKHTMVTGEKIDASLQKIEQKFETMQGIIASNRLDNIVSFVIGKSRSQSVVYIQSQKVFVNERLITSNAYDCKESDVISIRGFGKYIYAGSSGETRKGRMKVTIKKYI
ncbi:MAG: hypothetical protein J6A75_03595 [Lachnospiraceae bacterium]|nr:hypothetical protein [Lachnospiraceae bacterium]